MEQNSQPLRSFSDVHTCGVASAVEQRLRGRAGVIAIWNRIGIVTSLHYSNCHYYVVAPLHRCNVSAIASTVVTAELLHRYMLH